MADGRKFQVLDGSSEPRRAGRRRGEYVHACVHVSVRACVRTRVRACLRACASRVRGSARMRQRARALDPSVWGLRTWRVCAPDEDEAPFEERLDVLLPEAARVEEVEEHHA
eukprot:6175866-Pleurochrysis_carterae.AAC.4